MAEPSEALSRAALLASEREGFVHRMQVPFQHVDAAGIVFFARVLDYFHDAYCAFLEAHGHPLHEVLAAGRWAAPLVHASADYVRPLRFGDRVEVQILVAEVGESEVSFGYRIRGEGGEPRAVGRTRHVYVDPGPFRRIPIPDEVAAVLRTLA